MSTACNTVRNALDQFRSTLTSDDARTFSNATHRDLWEGARAIEQEQGRRMDLRFMRRVEPFLASMESYAPTIEVFTQGFPPMAFVWGPIKFFLHIARNYSDVIEKILRAYADMAEVLPRMDRIEKTFGTSPELQQVLALIYSDIIEFHRRAYRMFRRKAWHLWFAFDWGLFERRFKSIILRLASHCDLLDKEAASIHFMEMKTLRDKRLDEEEATEQHRHNQMAQDVFSWLSAADADQEEYLDRVIDHRLPGTCNFIFDDPSINSWASGEGGPEVVWMTGKPGAGKSFICSLIVQILQKQNGRSPLYYFCGQKSSEGDSCALVLRTLANQLLQQNRDLAPLVQQKYLAKGSSKSSRALKELLKEILSSAKSTHIILDGVDECNEATQLDVLKNLAEIQRHVGHHCKLLVSSRNEPLIQKAIIEKAHVPLEGKTVESLNLYIQAKTDDLKRSFPNVGNSLWTDIKRKLQDKAHGMFLWVRLVIVNLQQQTSEADLEIAADQLPDGLDQAYGRILSRIRNRHPTERDRAFKVLFWVCTAYRSVTIHEVADGITLKPGQTEINKKTRCQNVHEKIVDVCAPFLERSSRGYLEMIHFSAKEYLLDKQTGPFVDVPQAHFNAAFSCVVNLTSTLSIVPRYNNGHPDTFSETMLVQGAYGLQQYAHQHWAEHTKTYFGLMPQLDSQALVLVNALTTFLKVRKRREPEPTAQTRNKTTKDLQKISASLRNLGRFPEIQNLILSWMNFKSRLNESASNFDGLEALEKWQKSEDSTFLSLIDIQLRKLREDVLRMQKSNLPSHIATVDYDAFLSRYGFGCRVHDCSLNFEHELARDRHEASHAVFFPCLKCDFSGRGFRTRKQLEQHTRTYHMTHEDFEIPPTLEAASSYTTDPEPRNSISSPWSRRYNCWNEQGRKVLQSTLRKALSQVEEKMTLMDSSAPTESVEPTTAGPSICSKIDHSALSLDIIRSKIDAQQYDTLSEFKDNVYQALKNPATLTLSDSLGDLERICDQEVKNVAFGFPNFTSSEYTDPTPLHTQDAAQPDNGAAGNMDHRMLRLMVQKGPYWSIAEEAEFPRLVQQHGRNPSKIADCLMTKSSKEVEEHLTELVKSGRTDLMELADAADARAQQDVAGIQVDPEIEAPVLAELTTSGSSDENMAIDESLTPHSIDNPAPFIVGLDELRKRKPQNNPTNKAALVPNQQLTQGEAVLSTEKRKRDPRRKALCNYCKEEFHDEFTVFKHVDRFHVSTRKVWICEDVSTDQKFFGKCKHCLKKKRYSAKHNAFKHLRGAHFNLTTPQETLITWVKEIKVPNPNSDHKHTKALAAEHGDHPLGPSLNIKRRRIDNEPQSLNSPRLSSQAGDMSLPPMRLLHSAQSSSQAGETTLPPMRLPQSPLLSSQAGEMTLPPMRDRSYFDYA